MHVPPLFPLKLRTPDGGADSGDAGDADDGSSSGGGGFPPRYVFTTAYRVSGNGNGVGHSLPDVGPIFTFSLPIDLTRMVYVSPDVLIGTTSNYLATVRVPANAPPSLTLDLSVIFHVSGTFGGTELFVNGEMAFEAQGGPGNYPYAHSFTSSTGFDIAYLMQNNDDTSSVAMEVVEALIHA